MNIKIKHIFLLLFSFLVVSPGMAQSADEFKEHYSWSITNIHQEKIFIHTDKEVYITGETLWFKAYCVDASFHTLSDISKVVNIELIDENGKSLKKARIKLDKGTGSGQLFIAPYLKSGNFVLRSYTNWMKNFDPRAAFHKKISIINPNSNGSVDDAKENQKLFSAAFYPESGSLVSGVKSKIAVKVLDLEGLPSSSTGVIFDDQFNEISKFRTSENGIGTFFFSPGNHNKKYTANILLPDSSVQKVTLPAPQSSGVVMTVKNSEETFDVQLKAGSMASESAFLAIHSRGVLLDVRHVEYKSNENVVINKSDLNSGITTLTVLDNDFSPIAERLIFKFPHSNEYLELEDVPIEMTTREKVNLEFLANSTLSPQDLINASVSVSKIYSDSVAANNNVVSNLLIQSDINQHYEEISSILSASKKDREQLIDDILLTVGWRRFTTDKLGNKPEILFPAEVNTSVYSGKIIKEIESTDQNNLFLGFMGRSATLNSLQVDKQGNFHFEVPFRIKNEKSFFFSPDLKLESDDIQIDQPFDFEFDTPKFYGEFLSKETKSYFEGLYTNIQVSQVYRDHTSINGKLSFEFLPTSQFFGRPDFTYQLDEFTRFKTISDLFIEYIRWGVIRNTYRRKGLYVETDESKLVRPILVLDGVPIEDHNFMLNYDPLKVENVSIINYDYFFGEKKYPALISFTTYAGDFGGESLPEGIIEKVYYAIQQPRVFYSPNYEVDGEKLERIPDFRNTLYWNPNVLINSESSTELEFFTSDDTGTYRIELNGISSSGIPLHFTKFFRVNKSVP